MSDTDFTSRPSGAGSTLGRRAGRERRGPNRVRRGDVQAAVLGLLAEADMHGYQIITELAERSGGGWRPGPGSIYPTLRSLEERGMVRSRNDGARRVFHLTEYGRKSSRESGQAAPWQTFVENESPRLKLRRASEALLNALAQVENSGTEPQADRATAIASAARKSIYLMLAEDEN